MEIGLQLEAARDVRGIDPGPLPSRTKFLQTGLGEIGETGYVVAAVSTGKGGGFYGYKIHAAVCATTRLPLAWEVETGRRNESLYVAPLLDAVRARGFQPDTVAMDRGYDNNRSTPSVTSAASPPPGVWPLEARVGPLRVRGSQRVRLHADLVILGRLSLALARARAVPLASA